MFLCMCFYFRNRKAGWNFTCGMPHYFFQLRSYKEIQTVIFLLRIITKLVWNQKSVSKFKDEYLFAFFAWSKLTTKQNRVYHSDFRKAEMVPSLWGGGQIGQQPKSSSPEKQWHLHHVSLLCKTTVGKRGTTSWTFKTSFPYFPRTRSVSLVHSSSLPLNRFHQTANYFV